MFLKIYIMQKDRFNFLLMPFETKFNCILYQISLLKTFCQTMTFNILNNLFIEHIEQIR